MSENRNEQKSNPFIMIKNMILSWPLTVKIGACIFLIAIITGEIIYNNFMYDRGLISLYEQKISPEDIDEMKSVLSKAGYKEGLDFSVEEKDKKFNIMGQRQLAGEMRQIFEREGLPSSFEIIPKGSAIPTEDERQREARLQEQDRLARMITDMKGIKKATVSIVPKRDALFEEDILPARASVYIEKKDGYILNNTQTESIMGLVAGAVEGLDRKNITVVDEEGRIISDSIIKSEDPNGGIPLDVQHARQYDMQDRLTRNTQEFLDSVLGKGNSKVRINLTLNFDGTERLMTVYGNPGGGDNVSQNKSSVEGNEGIITIGGRSIGIVNNNGTFVSCGDEILPHSSGVHAISMEIIKEKYSKLNTDNSPDKSDAGYEKIEERINNQLNTYQTKIVTSPGKIERMTVALALNSIPEKYIEDLKQIVAASVGLEAGRGDYISVLNKPFINTAASNPPVPPVPPSAPASSINPAVLVGFCIAIGIMSLIYLTFYFVKQNKSNKIQRELCLTLSPASGFTNISDLGHDKHGRSVTVTPSTMKSVDELTILAKEKPSAVADLIKTSWMKDK